MTKKIYVGGLPFSTTETELNDLFTPLGEVLSAKLITDKFTGRSRGFGFVEMANEEEATNAINKLHNTSFGGRTLTVNEAKPMEPRSESRGPRRSFGHDKNY